MVSFVQEPLFVNWRTGEPISINDRGLVPYIDGNIQFGMKGDGVTNDQAAFQAALDYIKTLPFGGTLYLRRGTYLINGTNGVQYALTDTTQFTKRLRIIGDSLSSTIIHAPNITSGNAAFRYASGTGLGVESHFSLSNLRFRGNPSSIIAGSVGVNTVICAYGRWDDVYIEGFGVGQSSTDTEQINFFNCFWRSNTLGIHAGPPVAAITPANNWQFFGCTIGNNASQGFNAEEVNALNFYGGSIQYNGAIGGGSDYGIFVTDAGTGGYGTIGFHGTVFEGNGGLGDFNQSQQVGTVARVVFDNCSFTRTTAGYGTNSIASSGASTAVTLKVCNSCTFISGVGYAPSGARPLLNISNTNARLIEDGTSYFQNATEAPTWNYVPTVTPQTGAITSYTVNTAKYWIQDKSVYFSFDITITNAGTGAGNLIITLPFGTPLVTSSIVCQEIANTGVEGVGLINATGSTVTVRRYDFVTLIALNNRIVGAGTYQIGPN